ncbi:MAG: hypothetical protein J2P21_32575, partial [Chloracidobacterium sp.]|nr:hypothetical protein [Chloracidobacterium sp.]
MPRRLNYNSTHETHPGFQVLADAKRRARARHAPLRSSLISRRFVYNNNKALELQIKRHKCGEKNLSYAGLCKELTAWRNGSKTIGWLIPRSI